ncbi:MAG: hypothetical protein LBU22_09035 [Dysgonamonadaceae bacterium]|jgi:hypothetical protein|nr:hypothetical protein [Dysgonamonadaceae bacterium]
METKALDKAKCVIIYSSTIFKRIALFALFLLSATASYPQIENRLFSPKGIAEIHIQLQNDKTIDDIKNDSDRDYTGKLEAEINVRNSAYSVYESSQLHAGRILIEGRGYSSWELPKKSYNIDLTEATTLSPYLICPLMKNGVCKHLDLTKA